MPKKKQKRPNQGKKKNWDASPKQSKWKKKRSMMKKTMS